MKLTPNYTVKLLEKDNKHFYSVDNDPTLYPGSTTVLSVISKPYLINWSAKETAEYTKKILNRVRDIKGVYLRDKFLSILYFRSKKQHKFKKESSADIGTRAHKAIDDIINGNDPIITPDINFCVDGFILWLSENSLTIISGDLKLASLKYGYGGSLDALAVDHDGKLVVIDFKTSNQISDEYALQVASYCNALKEQFGLDYMPRGIIVRFSKVKVEIEIREIRSVEDSFKCFESALNLYVGMQMEQYQSKLLLKPENRRKKK
jgi:hypothetical protein